jgi:hypothetical protein
VTVRAAVVTAAVLVLAIPGVAGARSGEDVKALRALLQKQLTLTKQGQFRVIYRTTTTRQFRARCPYRRFVRLAREVRAALGPTAKVDRILVRFLSQRRALLSYRLLKNGRPVLQVRFSDGDVYAKVGSRWYDDYDRVGC